MSFDVHYMQDEKEDISFMGREFKVDQNKLTLGKTLDTSLLKKEKRNEHFAHS